MYDLQHGALAHNEQKAMKGPKITSVKPFKRENQRSNLYKKLRTGANICSGIKRFNCTKHVRLIVISGKHELY